MTANQDASGRLLADRYRLVSVLGRGGMGTVWRAVDEVLGRPVAVKELRFAAGVDEDERRRLIARTLTEAKAIARVRHTAAITVYDVVEEDDRPWIVMELVESRSLSEVISSDGVLPPLRAAEIGLELLAVLSQAHRSGILHRDVKPSNVLIGHDGRVVLTDFGIARVEGDPSVTSTGMLVGAPSYISPERARGRVPGAPADMWSLGATMYAMVEGHPPYDKGSALSTLTAVMTEELVPPAHGGPLVPVIAGLLRKDPEQRFDERTTRQLLLRVLAEAEAEGQQTAPQPPRQSSAAQSAQPPRQSQSFTPSFAPSFQESFPQAPERAREQPRRSGPRTATAGGPGYDRPTQRLREPAGPVPAQGAPTGFPSAAPDFPTATTQGVTGARRARRRLARVLVGVLALLVVAGGGVWVAMAQQSGNGVPPGFERVDAPGGATIEIPKGWTGTRLSADRLRYRGAAGTLVVEWTGTPGSSALADLRTEQGRTSGSYPDYHGLELHAVSYRGWNAADWAWTYTGSGGEALRSVERGFVADSHDGYSIDWTASASGWDDARNRDLLAGFYSSFQPASGGDAG